MKKSKNIRLQVCGLFIVTFCLLLTSCGSLTDQDKRYVGDWQLCSVEDNYPSERRFNIDTFHLYDDGSWKWGINHGKWGKDSYDNANPTESNPYNLRIKESSITYPYKGEATDIKSSITLVDGIPVLKLVIEYSYLDVGVMYDELRHESVAYDKKYKSSTNFYFVNFAVGKERLAQYFKDKDNQYWLKIITDRIYYANFDFSASSDSLYEIEKLRKELNLHDSDYVKCVIEAIEYGVKTGTASNKQLRLLQIINAAPYKEPTIKDDLDSGQDTLVAE